MPWAHRSGALTNCECVDGGPLKYADRTSDVFMDSVNRDISMRLMIDAARRAVGRQYIMITPQAMNSIQSVGDVKIIK
ncbi:hypothetical protein M011DRAFT_463356 [Sporormia fimetaria CBS 119925]|uniref:Uncharacterized protein n=1 Tax=Sporormia fimetaria CBS 119925 TaxID=1340428 RepID=A0A6A6VMN5_9PLEO|nr:hypothetical protein M011DRAFT_463356 [Sporormia fimetaria CBS 119925]